MILELYICLYVCFWLGEGVENMYLSQNQHQTECTDTKSDSSVRLCPRYACSALKQLDEPEANRQVFSNMLTKRGPDEVWEMMIEANNALARQVCAHSGGRVRARADGIRMLGVT